jgi:hypothetical protein
MEHGDGTRDFWVNTGLEPSSSPIPLHVLTPTATCELEQEKMRFMAGAGVTGVGGWGHAESRATGSQTHRTRLAACVGDNCQKAERAPPLAPPQTLFRSIRDENSRAGLKTPPLPLLHPAPAEAKSPQSSAAIWAWSQASPSQFEPAS